MKYIKSYKIFESNQSILDQIGVNDKSDREISEDSKQELEDALLYLKDDGHPVSVQVVIDYHALIFIKILNYENKQAKYGDIKDDLIGSISLVSDRFVPTCVYYKVVHPDGRIFNRGTRERVSWEKFLTFDDNVDLAYLSIELVQIVDDVNWMGNYKIDESVENIVSSTKYKCPICRSHLYGSDVDDNSAVLNCSSDEARYWELSKGSDEHKKAHDHFTRSTIVISKSEYDEISKQSVNLTGDVREIIPSSKVRTNS